MQGIQSNRYTELSQKNRIRLVPLLAPRGNIYDRNKNLLAGNRIGFDCAIIPQEFKFNPKGLRELSSILGVSTGTLRKKIRKDAVAPFAPVIIKKDIGKKSAIAISERSIDFPGLLIYTYPIRHYPCSHVGSHITGYLGRIRGDELNALRNYGYTIKDFVGRGGLELSYDNYLKGENGGIQTEVDSKGRQLRILGIREAEKGRDITLTIDIELEKYIDELLKEHKGAIIVVDSDSGGILGLVSKPDFDPNIFVSSSDSAAVSGLLRRRDYPLINRAISGTYPAGSIFKVVTASTALESGKIDAKEQLDCKGFHFVGARRFNCWKSSGHHLQTISDGIKNSCNVFFYQAGRRAGVEGISDYALFYGFGNLTQIDLPYENEGIVPNRIWKRRNKREAWYEGDTVNYAIGQGYLLVTPIQILRMINTVATEGRLITPFLVEKIDMVDVSVKESEPIDISKDTFKIIKEGTKRAVGEIGGTARLANVLNMEIAGKTGTAQTGTKKTHAWFAGFSPVEKPKISLIVFLEFGGRGGNEPCKIAASIFAKLRELEYL
jgi:penicillin-binding protein 2